MNYIKHLTGFFYRVSKDSRLNATHVSMYMAMFQFWNVSRFKNPISISRSEIMEISKVSSKNTYHKCMKELHKFGYIRYEPSYHPLRGSSVYILPFSKDPPITNQYIDQAGTEQVQGEQHTASEQDNDQLAPENEAGTAFQPTLNNYKLIKHNKLAFSKQSESDGNVGKIEESEKHRMPGAESFSGKLTEPSISIPESISAVKQFFQENKYPEEEALKFFHYFSSCGWKVGGKAPMKNWHSAAHNWMLNAKNLNQNADNSRPGAKSANRPFDTSAGKDYSEPL